MADIILQDKNSTNHPAESYSGREPLWYAAYTSANHEKRVAEQFVQRSVEYFLPLYRSVRRWKDRKVNLQRPLFPGYVFVRIELRNRLKVLQVPGVAKLISFNGTPAALPQGEVDALRTSLLKGAHAQPHPYLAIGRQVMVTKGPMAGLQGVLKRKKGNARLVVSIELIQRAMAVEIDEDDVETVESKRRE
jgi:transcription antitermination factor NusG